MAREIPLTRGYVALVDDEDYERVARFKWQAANSSRAIYALHSMKLPNGRRRTIRMHRVVTGAPRDLEVDHIDGNGLDNRKSNLRLATKSQNMHNITRKAKNKTSRFKGVSWRKGLGMWIAQIKNAGKVHYLGMYSDEEEARDAYAAASRLMHGEFAAPYVEAAE